MNAINYKFSKMVESHLLYIETKNLIIYEKVRKMQLEILSDTGTKMPQYQHEVNRAVENILLDIYNSNNFRFDKSLISIPKI